MIRRVLRVWQVEVAMRSKEFLRRHRRSAYQMEAHPRVDGWLGGEPDVVQAALVVA